MSVCVNLERLFAIVYPLKTLRGKGAMIPASLSFAVAYNAPKFFELEIGDGGDRLVTTQLRNDPLYRDGQGSFVFRVRTATYVFRILRFRPDKDSVSAEISQMLNITWRMAWTAFLEFSRVGHGFSPRSCFPLASPTCESNIGDERELTLVILFYHFREGNEQLGIRVVAEKGFV